jgi:hypothetical protein
MLAVPSPSKTGMLVIHEPLIEPPFHGVCFLDAIAAKGYYWYPPELCFPFSPTYDFKVSPGYRNIYLSANPYDASVGFSTCYSGPDELEDTRFGFWDSTGQTNRIGADPAYSCTEAGSFAETTNTCSHDDAAPCPPSGIGQAFIDHLPDVNLAGASPVPAVPRWASWLIMLVCAAAGCFLLPRRRAAILLISLIGSCSDWSDPGNHASLRPQSTNKLPAPSASNRKAPTADASRLSGSQADAGSTRDAGSMRDASVGDVSPPHLHRLDAATTRADSSSGREPVSSVAGDASPVILPRGTCGLPGTPSCPPTSTRAYPGTMSDSKSPSILSTN